jgi:hypothetical protein
VLSLWVVGCARHDLGQSCPQLLGEDDVSIEAGETSRETQEVVGQDTVFPCEELICIATDGLPGYCSKKCRADAGCPEGFECRVAWKHCAERADCGKAEDFCCTTVAGSAPIDELEIKLCAFSDDGKC